MIYLNTDKYEGHLVSEGQTWVWSKWMSKNNETIEQYNATAALLNDAPLLLEEVKRLQEVAYRRICMIGERDKEIGRLLEDITRLEQIVRTQKELIE